MQGREQRGRVGRAHTSCRWLLTDPERRPQVVLRRLLVPAQLGRGAEKAAPQHAAVDRRAVSSGAEHLVSRQRSWRGMRESSPPRGWGPDWP